MEDISILGLVWDSFNEAHIWERHQLTRADVEEVAYGLPENLYACQTYGSRLLVIGPGANGRLMVLILAPKGAGRFYPVSARPADKRERREYREWKASKQS